MKITGITPYVFAGAKTSSKLRENNEYNQSNYAYNPIAYKDYNINFTARLWRSPENFFGCQFNLDNMPDTMKKYLYDDFEDRQKMPPAQMLKLVFDDIKNAQSLEEVKKLYNPEEEPLFKDLTDKPNKKTRTGTLAYIDLMKEDGKTLFKNGDDNLGLYILKKIYTECKTLKEINNDFAKDISVYYKGLPELDYQTLHSFGIKFPKHSFWKSLTATRAEFPYEYKPRKAIESRRAAEAANSHTTTEKQPVVRKKKFDDVKDWEIQKVSEALIKGNGSLQETQKQMKKRNIRNSEIQNFVCKYMGEINSVVLEKLHISPDMKDYFYEIRDIDKNHQEKFSSYMKNEFINDLRSKVMSYTIRLFFDLYGVDGQNEEFQELLEYARNIKPNRIASLKEHERIQSEYDEMFANLPYDPFTQTSGEAKAADELNGIAQKTVEKEDDSYESSIAKYANENNQTLYKFKLSNGTIFTVSDNLQDRMTKRTKNEFKYYPESYVENYTRNLLHKSKNMENYFMSLIYNLDAHSIDDLVHKNDFNASREDEEKLFRMFREEYLISPDKLENMSQNIIDKYEQKHPIETNAVKETLSEILSEYKINQEQLYGLILEQTNLLREIDEFKNLSAPEIQKQIFSNLNRILAGFFDYSLAYYDPKQMNEILKILGNIQNDEIAEKLRPMIEKKYSIYNQKLSKEEIIKLPEKIIDTLSHFDINKSKLKLDESKYLLKAIAESIANSREYRKLAIQILKRSNYITPERSDLRAFLRDDVSPNILEGKAEILLVDLMNNISANDSVSLYINIIPYAMDTYVRNNCPNYYNLFINQKLNLLLNKMKII